MTASSHRGWLPPEGVLVALDDKPVTLKRYHPTNGTALIRHRNGKESWVLITNLNRIKGVSEMTPQVAAKSGTISQYRLRQLFDLEAEYHALKERYESERDKIQSEIDNGALQERGKYLAEIKESPGRRSPKYKEVLIKIKGQAYVDELLEATAPGAPVRQLIIKVLTGLAPRRSGK